MTINERNLTFEKNEFGGLFNKVKRCPNWAESHISAHKNILFEHLRQERSPAARALCLFLSSVYGLPANSGDSAVDPLGQMADLRLALGYKALVESSWIPILHNDFLSDTGRTFLHIMDMGSTFSLFATGMSLVSVYGHSFKAFLPIRGHPHIR